MDAFKDNAVVIRPGFIHGTRKVPLPKAIGNIFGEEVDIPLWVFGK
jgi:hypothetical protein